MIIASPAASKAIYVQEYWGVITGYKQVPAGAADWNLESVVVALPSGALVLDARMILRYSYLFNQSGAGDNGFTSAQQLRIKISTGTWDVDDIDAITSLQNIRTGGGGVASRIKGVQNSTLADNHANGGFFVGSLNLTSVVSGDGTYNIQWEDMKGNDGYLEMYGAQVGLSLTIKV